MIDLAYLRDESEKIKDIILKKDPSFNVNRFIELDNIVRKLKTSIDHLRNERNGISNQAKKGISEELRNKSIEISRKIKEEEECLESSEKEFEKIWLSCPNLLFEDVPAGNKEKNEVIKIFQEKPEFTFKPKNHVELGESLGWLDFHAAASMSGAQFALYKGKAVKLIYTLITLMFKINTKHGFTPVSTPEIVTERALINSGNLPKFAEDVYKISADNLYLIPTAEVPLTNLYADKILQKEELPMRFCAKSNCFRREAGGYGAQERGLIRIHQFDKVELYTLCEPKNSADEQERMLACAEEILQTLGLHYRVSLLAAQDCSFSSAKTYDVEVWLPGQDRYYEVSSISNCTDFQARRAAIRYREDANAKPKLVHTLNASSLALPRLIIALMETYQQRDGSVVFPVVLEQKLEALW